MQIYIELAVIFQKISLLKAQLSSQLLAIVNCQPYDWTTVDACPVMSSDICVHSC